MSQAALARRGNALGRGSPQGAARAVPGTAPRAAPAPTRVDYVEKINRSVKLLVLDLFNRFRNDARIYRVKERVCCASALDPVFVVNVVGQYLFRYREQIYAGGAEAEKFFMENSYDAELREGVVQEKVDLTAYIIPKVKEVWGSLDPAAKQRYREMVTAILDDYVEYLALGLPAK